MQVTTPTELIRHSKRIFDLVSKKGETMIIHRKRGEDLVLITLDEWNRKNEPDNDHLHGYPDETAYLLSTEANKAHLLKSIQEGKEGKTTSIKTEDLWK